jgi:hypothetical protein
VLSQGLIGTTRTLDVETLVDQDSVHPTVEPTALVEAGKALIDLDECVLRGVVGLLVISEDSKRDVEQHPVITLHDGLKGVPVTCQALSDRVEIVGICG